MKFYQNIEELEVLFSFKSLKKLELIVAER